MNRPPEGAFRPKGRYSTHINQTNQMQALETMIPERETFNGWTNYEPWNVALWLQNDEAMYTVAKHYSTYDALIPRLEYRFGQMTPDGVRWMDGRIDTDELDEMLQDL